MTPIETYFTKLGNPSEQIDRMYFDSMENLKGEMQVHFGGVKPFCDHCEKNGLGQIDHFNLSKIFSKNVKSEMSVGLFIRILIGLGMAKPDDVLDGVTDLNIPLRKYLKVNHDIVMRSFYILGMS